MYRTLAGIVSWTVMWSSSVNAGPVDIGSLSGFALFGGAAISDTGTSRVTGDVGISPGSAVSGFLPGAITGALHFNDGATLKALSDWDSAAAQLDALPCGTQLTGQDLGGMTLSAGVYCFASSAQLTGTLTLAAGPDPAAQFVFKIGTALTTASNAAVVFSGNASGNRLFWQAGTSATLGTGTHFAGNILADASVGLDSGATLIDGRALARIGAVTLDDNRIAIPVAVPDAVPEPAAWSLMTAGFGFAGMHIRRRRGLGSTRAQRQDIRC